MWEFPITLWCGPRGQFINLGPKSVCFCLILQEFCDFSGTGDLHYFDIPKDVVFPEILVLSNVFGFLAVNWALKWTKTVNFGCIPFEPKFKILKDSSNTVFVLLEKYLWSKSQQDRTIFEGVWPKIPKKGPFHRCWINRKNFEKFLLHNHKCYTDETY